jgi:hypothetical protein
MATVVGLSAEQTPVATKRKTIKIKFECMLSSGGDDRRIAEKLILWVLKEMLCLFQIFQRQGVHSACKTPIQTISQTEVSIPPIHLK